MSGLASAVPTFLGGQLVEALNAVLQPKLIAACVGEGKNYISPVQTFLSTIAKNVPSKTTFPAVFKLWDILDKTDQAVSSSLVDLDLDEELTALPSHLSPSRPSSTSFAGSSARPTRRRSTGSSSRSLPSLSRSLTFAGPCARRSALRSAPFS